MVYFVAFLFQHRLHLVTFKKKKRQKKKREGNEWKTLIPVQESEQLKKKICYSNLKDSLRKFAVT